MSSIESWFWAPQRLLRARSDGVHITTVCERLHRWLHAALLVGMTVPVPAPAQTAAEHAAHHPDTVAAGPQRALPLPVSAPAERVQLLRDGKTRMAEGAAMLSAGVNRLSTATTLERYDDMLTALDQMRMAIGVIESGVSVRMALDTSARGVTPPEYLRAELSAERERAARLSPGHVAFMIVAVLIGAAMLLLQVIRVRRIGALRARR